MLLSFNQVIPRRKLEFIYRTFYTRVPRGKIPQSSSRPTDLLMPWSLSWSSSRQENIRLKLTGTPNLTTSDRWESGKNIMCFTPSVTQDGNKPTKTDLRLLCFNTPARRGSSRRSNNIWEGSWQPQVKIKALGHMWVDHPSHSHFILTKI